MLWPVTGATREVVVAVPMFSTTLDLATEGDWQGSATPVEEGKFGREA